MELWERGILGPVVLEGKDITEGQWSMQPGVEGEFLKLYTHQGAGVVKWNKHSSASHNVPLTWFKYSFDLPNLDPTGAYAFVITGLTKGFLWVNERHIGRYWTIEATWPSECVYCNYTGPYGPGKCRVDCGEPSQLYYHIPADWLQTTGNFIVVFEEIGAPHPDQIQLVQRTGGTLCGSAQEDFPAENTQVYLRCDPGTVVKSIDFASFGTPTGTCGNYQVSSCNAAATTQVSDLCMGESSCYLPVSYEVYGDPCPGVTKTLAVQVTCG